MEDVVDQVVRKVEGERERGAQKGERRGSERCEGMSSGLFIRVNRNRVIHHASLVGVARDLPVAR